MMENNSDPVLQSSPGLLEAPEVPSQLRFVSELSGALFLYFMLLYVQKDTNISSAITLSPLIVYCVYKLTRSVYMYYKSDSLEQQYESTNSVINWATLFLLLVSWSTMMTPWGRD